VEIRGTVGSAGRESGTDFLRQARAYLDDVVTRLGDYRPVPLTTEVLEGEVVHTIRATVAGKSADLVVMTAHGRGPMQRLWLGSVADALLRELTVPLLLVRPVEGQALPTTEPILKHMLIPLDGSPLAEQIIEPALTIGTLMDADYTLLRVIEPVLFPEWGAEGATLGNQAEFMIEKVQAATAAMCKKAQEYLEQVGDRLRKQSRWVQTKVVVESHPALVILREAVPPMDVIALETHGRHGVARMFMGSVADKVVRGSALPILVHRPERK